MHAPPCGTPQLTANGEEGSGSLPNGRRQIPGEYPQQVGSGESNWAFGPIQELTLCSENDPLTHFSLELA